MKHHPTTVGQRVKCGTIPVLATVQAIRCGGMVLDVEYDDEPGTTYVVHQLDAVVVDA